jgi:peptidyl-prolyl cis-trans isomerase C
VKRNSNVMVGCAAVLFFLAAGLSVTYAEQSKSDNEILVRIGKDVITQGELELRLSDMKPEVRKNYSTDQQKKEYLDQIVRGKLLALEAKAEKMDREKDLALRLQDAVNWVLANEYIKTRLFKGINVTDRDVDDYYQAHKDDFKKPATVRVQHILVKIPSETKKEEDINAYLMKAQHIKNELDGGADFKTAAAKYSDDVQSKRRGGDLGFISRKQVVPEFAEVAFNLKEGEVSNPIKTAYGYHIIKLTDRIEESQKTLKEASGEIGSLLKNQGQKAVIEKEVERLKKKYHVVYDKR